jgi:CheY-like chemotaxis protein
MMTIEAAIAQEQWHLPRRSPLCRIRGMSEARILVADDDQDTVLSLTALLREEGYAVRGVHRGAEVLDAVFNFAPDVVLLDIGMPQMSGYDVARTLRERYGSARPALIAVTGRAGAFDRRQAHAAGFEHHVAKPYEPRELLRLIGQLSAR